MDVGSWGSHFTFVGLSFLINRMENVSNVDLTELTLRINGRAEG